MNMRFCFGILILLCATTLNVSAGLISSSGANLVDQIKPNLTTRSKPTTSPYPKYASVSFLTDDTKLDFGKGEIDVRTQCASLGYAIPVSACTGDLKPSYLCSKDVNREGASAYTSGCCNAKVYTATSTDACDNNSTAQVSDSCYFAEGGLKYRCSCDRSRYPYSTIQNQNGDYQESCGSKGSFNVSNTCRAYEPKTKKIETYYSGCCPNSYVECGTGNTHTIGVGTACNVWEGGKSVPKYASCTCASHFDTVCSKSMLINSSYYCELNGSILTTDSNCESGCTKTSETNLDEYLYGATWHCLYEPEGATLKPTSEELNGYLCRGYALSGANSGSISDTALNECDAQGYTKSDADCYNNNIIVRCPTDSSKVWCNDSKYCTGYDVGTSACVEQSALASGSTDINTLKNKGAKVEFCADLSQGVRCKYQHDDCNKGWSEGKFTGSGWVNLDDNQNKGDTEKCCNRGYRMDNTTHKCVENVCDKTRFPYAQNPGEDAGTLETCYEADSSESLGYKAYFGYSKCNDDVSKGELWIVDPNNNRRCVCARNGEGGRDYYLPFTTATFYNTNGDISNNYANTGFNAGYYGKSTSCTDADGSYYGYTMCYMGRYMGTAATNRGMCLIAEPTGYTTYYGYYSGIWVLNDWLKQNGFATVSTEYEPRTSADSYCVHKYTHCLSQDGKKLGDDAVCALVPEGCNEGIEAACNQCRHVASVVKGSDGLYHIRADKMIIELNTCRNNAIYPGISTCPTGFKHGGGGYGICYKYCYTSDLSKCAQADMLYSGSTRVGIVIWKSDNTLKIVGAAIGSLTWDEAKTYAANYAPEGLENDAIFGKGKWMMPTNTGGFVVYQYKGAAFAEGFSWGNGTWLDVLTDDGVSAYYAPNSDNPRTYPRTYKMTLFPIVQITY